MTGALYAAAASLAAPGLRLMLRRRVRRGKEIAARLPERRGLDPTPRPPGRLLWLHAASVGEAVSVLPVIAALDPAIRVLFTTGTTGSAALLARRLPELGPDRVLHRFVPLDVPGWAARFLDHWRPDAAAFVESELWPNLLRACRRRGVSTALVNARLSARSHAAWRWAPRLAREMLGGLALVLAGSEGDADRLRDLGAPQARLLGDLKFAAPPLPADPTTLARLRAAIADRPVWLAASTHPGEEAVVAGAHDRLRERHPGLTTIIVPRHPERGPALAASLRAARRGAGAEPGPGVWIADTLGELGLFYRLCPIVLMGKSLLPPGGGQNPLEPARLGCAVACGPWVNNFPAAVQTLRTAGASAQVADGAELAAWVDAMLRDPVRRAAMGEAARAVATRHDDLPGRVAAALSRLIGHAV